MMPCFDYPPRGRDLVLRWACALEEAGRGVARRIAGRGPAQASGFPAAGEAGSLSRAPAGEAPWKDPIVLLPALPWRYRFQRPQQLARAFAELGHPVLYVDGFRGAWLRPPAVYEEPARGVGELRLRVPGRPDPFREQASCAQATDLAGRILRGLRRPPHLILAQLPFWEAVARELAARTGAPLLYDRIDLHTAFPTVPVTVGAAEARLLAAADGVTAASAVLAELSRGGNGRVELVPNGVAWRDFAHLRRRPAARPPTAIYVGALADWFDAAAVERAALALPGWRFVLCGEVESRRVAALGALPNVELRGEVAYAAVPSSLAAADVALVTLRDTALTRAAEQVKLYEALAAGVPVVARALPDTQRWPEPVVYLYRSPEELAARLVRARDEDCEAHVAQRRRLAAGEDWTQRARRILALAGPAAAAEPA